MHSGIYCTHGGVSSSMQVHHWASPHAVYASEPATCVCNKSCNAQDTAHWPVYWHYPLRWKVIEQEVPVINTSVLNQGSTKVNQPVEIKEALLCAITAKSTFSIRHHSQIISTPTQTSNIDNTYSSYVSDHGH